MKKLLIIGLLLITGCSAINFNQTNQKFDKDGNVTEETTTKYEKTGYCPQWSPEKDISFEYHNI